MLGLVMHEPVMRPAAPTPCLPAPALNVSCPITTSSAEYTKRGDDFKQELDFVFANLVM